MMIRLIVLLLCVTRCCQSSTVSLSTVDQHIDALVGTSSPSPIVVIKMAQFASIPTNNQSSPQIQLLASPNYAARDNHVFPVLVRVENKLYSISGELVVTMPSILSGAVYCYRAEHCSLVNLTVSKCQNQQNQEDCTSTASISFYDISIQSAYRGIVSLVKGGQTVSTDATADIVGYCSFSLGQKYYVLGLQNTLVVTAGRGDKKTTFFHSTTGKIRKIGRLGLTMVVVLSQQQLNVFSLSSSNGLTTPLRCKLPASTLLELTFDETINNVFYASSKNSIYVYQIKEGICSIFRRYPIPYSKLYPCNSKLLFMMPSNQFYFLDIPTGLISQVPYPKSTSHNCSVSLSRKTRTSYILGRLCPHADHISISYYKVELSETQTGLMSWDSGSWFKEMGKVRIPLLIVTIGFVMYCAARRKKSRIQESGDSLEDVEKQMRKYGAFRKENPTSRVAEGKGRLSGHIQDGQGTLGDKLADKRTKRK